MSDSYSSGGFGRGNHTDGIWQAVEQLRSTLGANFGSNFGANFGKREGTRVGKGDVPAAVLALLAEQPMHGYQIIREIEERSGGTWKPSAGSVYPTLQLLADEGLIEASESNGRKTYALTEAGRERVAETEGAAPWDSAESPEGSRFSGLPKAGIELAQATARVGRSGSPEQVQEAITVLDDARRRIYLILAQD
ncbi:PadR family transcriptional regulator [Subtercola lobariae]|uniref:Transcription regulator PadR N-terminal domain-containing protein n=1 Tax=Subtercola lobariae TaxID=1588641 RepID=A0A917BE05_9MICO|nr:PadR family transcriptional regulator [Subtercola lobariae]GGF39452.1 hypothetical protein GCM10011399_35440 [Subtercola lobariae]